jgi:hypothetical protein
MGLLNVAALPAAPVGPGPEVGAKYTLYGSDGSRGVFNDRTDPDWIGDLEGPEGITGLDSAEVREDNEDRIEANGGVHGVFYFGRRPIVMTGKIVPQGATPAAGVLDRNTRLDKLQRVSRMMGRDGQLVWTPTGGIELRTRVRRQVPLRAPGNYVKDFQLGIVAEDPVIYSTAWEHASVLSGAQTTQPLSYDRNGDPVPFWGYQVAQLSVTNLGNAGSPGDLADPGAPGVFTIYGPGTNPAIINATTGQGMFFGITLADTSQWISVDTRSATVRYYNGANAYGTLFTPYSQIFGLVRGVNDLRLIYYSNGTGASMAVDWRHAWL